MRKRTKIRIISYLAVGVAALTAWGAVNAFGIARLKRQQNAANERALAQLGTYLGDIAVNLEKCRYVSTAPMLADISSQVWRSSTAAKTSLAQLTGSGGDSSGLYKFLSQVGEYTVALNKKVSSGETLTEDENATVERLGKSAAEISGGVNRILQSSADGTLDFDEVRTTLSDSGSGNAFLGDEITDVSQTVKDSPTLIYDGPFSDHIGKGKSYVLELLPEITRDEAKRKCAEFLQTGENSVFYLGETQSGIDTFSFYNTEKTVSITKKGGVVSYMISSRFVGEARLKPENAVEIAAKFLNNIGYEDVKDSYYAVNDGVCTVNFAFYEDGITYYTDLIKVGVALDNGEILTFDATGYLMNHRERVIESVPEYSPEQAAKLIKPSLTVTGYKPTFIPTKYETEIFVYEYRCKTADGTELLVYIDPVSGAEREILILLYTDGGILTR